MANCFWKVVEFTLKYDIPDHIKNSVSISGFDDALIFKDLSDTDIAKIEQHMRERALDEIATTLSESFGGECEAVVDEKQMIEVFGENYAKCPEKFEFLPGEKKMLQVLANHVKKLVDGGGENTGLAQFNSKKKRIKKKNLILNRIAERRHQTAAAKATNTNHRLSTKGMFRSLQICLSSYDMDIDRWKEDLVQVDSSGNGSVKCILCDENEEPKRVYYHAGSRSSFWVFSNFKTHLKKKHKLVPNVKQKSKNNEALILVPENKDKPASDAEDSSPNTTQSIDTHSEKLVNVKTEQPSIELNDSVQFLGALTTPVPAQADNNTDTWLYEQMSVQMQQMVEANMMNSESEELMHFKLKDEQQRSISVVKTSPDGNCLFSALAHQLWPNPITSKAHIQKTEQLRATVVEHILDPKYYHLYEQIIADRLNKKTAAPTSECKLFIRFGLARGKWGGLESLKAVSNTFHVNVVIINEFGSCNMITGSDTYNRTVVIAYRLNEASIYDHYDSVSDIDAEGLFIINKFITNK